MFLLEIPPRTPNEPFPLINFEMKSKHSRLQGKVDGGFFFFQYTTNFELKLKISF